MKKLLGFLLIGLITSMAIISCKDDFNEEDFLKLQSDLRLKQDSINRARNAAVGQNQINEYISALNQTGDLLGVTLLIRENGVPVSGVSVALTTAVKNTFTSGRTEGTTVTATTDATGTVVFDKVTIGSGNIVISKAGYITATANVDFGTPGAPIVVNVPNPANPSTNIAKYLPPQKRFEEAAIQIFSASATSGSTATIRGRVTIENDVTNLTPEIPSGVVIRANLAGLAVNPGGFISSYTFEDNSTLGVATVNATTGDFTMTVPATAAGVNIPLIVPNIEGTCRMAVNGYDNGTGAAVTLVNGPEYRDVPTSWGPQAITGFGTTIPAVVGAKITFPAAPAAGSGLTFDLAEVARAFQTGTWNSAGNQTIGNVIMKITDRGDYGSGAAPTIAVTGGGGSGITALANIRSYISAITVTTAGTGYTGNININFVRTNGAGSDLVLNSISIPNTGGGLPTSINLSQFAGTSGFASDNQLSLGNDISGLKVTVTGTGGTGATVSATFKTEVESVNVNNGGNGFTSRPTFTFAGGGLTAGDSKHADIEVVDFPVTWTINPNNTASTGYGVLPANFQVSYPSTSVSNGFTQTQVDLYSNSGIAESFGSNFRNQLTVSGGGVVKRDAARSIRTSSQWSSKPSIIVTNEVPANASAAFTAANINSTTGAITGMSTLNNQGNGYSTNFTGTIAPAATGAPGTGATISLTNSFDVNNSEWTWGFGFSITNGGSGYLQNLNQRGVQGSSIPASVNTVQAGKAYTIDIVYGTGNRKVSVN